MKNKKTIKIAVLLLLVMCLGVGYAVVSSVSLSITGTAGAQASTLKVAFTADKNVSNTSKGTISVTAGATTASFTATNMVLNETITYTYTIKNSESDVTANVALTATGSNSYFTVSTNGGSSSTTSFTLAPGASTTVKVVVKMIKTPVASANNSANFTVTIASTPAS